jgi:hypothetical protein
MASYTGTITVKIRPRLLGHTPAGDGFFDITKRIAFGDGSSPAFTFSNSSDGSLSTLNFMMYTMFPNSTSHWSAYTGATDDLKVQAALDDFTYPIDIPSRTEVEVFENGTKIFGGVATDVSRVSTGSGMGTGSAILTQVKCSDYTALLDEVVLSQYKSPYDTADHQLIRGGYATNADINGLKILKVSDGDNGSGKRQITVSVADEHDLNVGQQVVIDRTDNYNSTWTVSSVGSVTTFTAVNTALTYSGVDTEITGRSTPKTQSFFSNIRTTDPYSGNAFDLGIDYTTYVEENSNETLFSKIAYLPDANFPAKLGAQTWIPLSSTKSETGRLSFDPKAMDSKKDLYLGRIDSDLVERYIIRSMGSYDTTSDYIDVTVIGNHNIDTGQVVSYGNVRFNNPGTYSSGFRADRQSSTVIRNYTSVDPGFEIRSSGSITGVETDGTYATYICSNTFVAGDPVGIYGITQTGSGDGSLNVNYSIVEEASATQFKIKNSTAKVWSSGGVAYGSYIQVLSPQYLQADAKRYKIIAAKRERGITTVWHNGPSSWFDQNDIVHISGSSNYDGKFTITAVGNDSAGPTAPFHVVEGGRTNKLVALIVGGQTTPWTMAATKKNKPTHPFKVGDVITVSVAGSANYLDAVNVVGATITKVNGPIIYYAQAGNNTRYEQLTKTERGNSTVYLTTAGYSYFQFADDREEDADYPGSIGTSATVALYNYAWAASSGGGRSSATPSASFITMPSDTLTPIGGRGSVSFTSSSYQGISSRKIADVRQVTVASNVVTIYTKHVHRVSIGETITAALTTNTTLNGSYTVTATTPDTLSYAKTTSNLALTADTGTIRSEGLGFSALGRDTTALVLIRPSSLPSGGNYKTIWHHGSISTGQRRELSINSSGQLVFTVNGTYITSGTGSLPSMIAGETAVIALSYNPSSGALIIQKNDTTKFSATVSSPAETNMSNLSIGYGYNTSSTASKFFDGLIGDLLIFNRSLDDTERAQMIAWMLHWYTRADLLDEDNTYRYISTLPGKTATSKLKEVFNAMTLRQALDYVAKKTGSLYWVDADKKLHYVNRAIKNYVSNPTFEDSYGNAGTTGWTLNGFTLSNARTDGPYGYGYALTYSGTSAVHAESKKFAVTPGDKIWGSAMIKTGNASKSRLKIIFYDSNNTQLQEQTLGSGVTNANQWEYMWGIKAAPGQAAFASLAFDHTAHGSTYTDYYADPFVTKLTGEFGFADYGIAPGSTAEYMFDTNLTGVMTLRPFESPENISQSGSVTNRVHVYGKSQNEDTSGSTQSTDVITGQVARFTFDYVQGVWQSHGKIVEMSTSSTNVETQEDAVLVAKAKFAESGNQLESFEFMHPTNASDGRLTTGSVIPYLWSQVGVIKPLIVKAQQTQILGGEAYYSVTLGGEQAFTKNAVVLVQRNELTEALGSGNQQYLRPSPITNLIANTTTSNGVATSTDLRISLRWSFDFNDARNKLFSHFQLQRRSEELLKIVKGTTNLAKSANSTDYVVKRTAAAAGGVSTVTLSFDGSLSVPDDGFITIKGWKLDAKETTGSLNGTWEIQSVSVVTVGTKKRTQIQFYMYAGNAAIKAKNLIKTKVMSLSFSWYETVKTRNNGWGDLLDKDNKNTALKVTATAFTDADTSYAYRYQYRIRAVSKDSIGGTREGDWVYIPTNYASTTDRSAWLYVTRDLSVAGSDPISPEDTP